MHSSVNVGRKRTTRRVFFGLSGTGKTTLSADPERIAHRRRRARLGCRRAVQLRGRLLRQDDPPLVDVRARHLRHDPPLRHHPRERRPRPGHPRAGPRLGALHREHPRRVSARVHRQRRPDRHRRPSAKRHLPDRRCVRHPARRSAGCRTSRRSTTSSAAIPPSWPAPRSASRSRRRRSRRHSARPSCRAIPGEYAAMLAERLEQHDVPVWLVNTGWTGGPYGIGERMSIDHTRNMVRAALERRPGRRAVRAGSGLRGPGADRRARRARRSSCARAAPGRTRTRTTPRRASWPRCSRRTSRPTPTAYRPPCVRRVRGSRAARPLGAARWRPKRRPPTEAGRPCPR